MLGQFRLVAECGQVGLLRLMQRQRLLDVEGLAMHTHSTPHHRHSRRLRANDLLQGFAGGIVG